MIISIFCFETEILEDDPIITSDHGENFGEHGFFEHQLCIYNTLIHVPLIIRFPNFLPKNIDARVSTVEIFPTIVDILNAERSELMSTESARSRPPRTKRS